MTWLKSTQLFLAENINSIYGNQRQYDVLHIIELVANVEIVSSDTPDSITHYF